MAITRADVARAAGVSPALVSYVLNGGPRPVSAEARERVLAAVAELNYRPNRIARALRENRTHSIAMLMPDHRNPHFGELAQAVEDEAFRNDYMLIIGTADNQTERESAYLRAFVDRQVDGLLLISAASHPDVSMLDEVRLPVVLLDRAPQGTGFSSVVIDNRTAAAEAVDHLLSHDRRNPVCLAGPAEIDAVQERVAGWQDALDRAGMTAAAPVHTSFSSEGGYRAMRELITAGRAFDAVFATSDAQAIGAIAACAEAGLRVPDDLAVVAFDGTEAGRYGQPPLTSVDQDVAALARTALETLVGLSRREHTEAVHRVLRPRLRIGRSCGCTPEESVGGGD
ncbi:LacI family DNA-binding transcriptional regulator [Microlunatus sp. GCM10028923]|uniref:LacI family DNA-binding transcriptional regulator n=1 Tax=Microlunatus sp. GCM10028923 TaxID=3273400 RepID=UPI00360DF86B